MKKIILIYSFLAFASISVNAQEPTNEQKKVIFKNVDKLLKNYLDYSKFDDKEYYKKYTNLFSNSSIKLIDEMNPEFYYTGDKEHPDTNLLHTITEILEKNKTNFPSGFLVKLLASDVSYKSLSTNIVKVYLEKATTGTNASGLSFTATTTLLLEIKVNSNDNFSSTIQNINLINYKLQVSNDGNKDYKNNEYVKAVNNAAALREANKLAIIKRIEFVKDSTKKANERLAKHIADSIQDRLAAIKANNDRIAQVKELMEEPPHLWLSGGLLLGTASSTPTQSDFINNYDSKIASKSTSSTAKFKYLHSTGGQIMLHKYFGKTDDKANWGVGIGLKVATYKGSLQQDAFAIQYKANDQWNGTYRQIITSVGGINEQVNINNLSIPILVSVKNKLKGKWGYNIQAGLVYHLSFGDAISNTTAKFDYEAVYKFSGDKGNPTKEYDASDNFSNDAWLITKQQAGNHLSNGQTVDQYFTDMKSYGYYVGLNQAPANVSKNFKYSSGAVGFVFNPSITYEIQKPEDNPILLTFGIHYETTSFKNPKTDYKLIDEKQNYSSLMNSFSTISVQTLGAYFGLSIPLNYNKTKWQQELTTLQSKKF